MPQHVRCLFMMCVFWVTLAWAMAAMAAPQVTAFRIGAHPDKTRVVLEFSGAGEVRYRLQQATPSRLLLDLTGSSWKAGTPVVPAESGIVKTASQAATGGGVRLILEMRAAGRARTPFFIPATEGRPMRLVIDLVAGGGGVPVLQAATPPARREAVSPLPETPVQAVLRTASVPVPEAKPVTASVTGPVARVSGRPVIVIDAGHGGKDPGAIGPTGTREKEITLRTALELRNALARTGRYTVYLTRSDDRFIILRDRTRIAQRHKADLFISLHADAHARPDAKGLSVYTLSETASDREAAALAARENKADLIGGVDLRGESSEVSSILIDLVQRETMNLSAKYAQALVTSMQRRVAILPNPHRFAGFMVLKAPDTPSVLLEMGFISNEKEEWQLKQRGYRARIVAGIVEATDRYFDSQLAVTMR